MKKNCKMILLILISFLSSSLWADSQFEKILHQLSTYQFSNKDERVAFLTKQFINAPYIYSDILSGGNDTYSAQSIYRLDKFDCQTFVQVIIAFLHAHNKDQFHSTIQKMAFKDGKNITSNNNNFPDGDWNPENRKQGFIEDVTSNGALAPFALFTSANLTRKRWASYQHQKIIGNTQRNYFETVWISYLPKEILLKNIDNHYVINQTLFDKIPTPSVLEVVKDSKNWKIGDKYVRDIIGSELNVSHMGILYRQTFHRGQLIYHKIYCDFNSQNTKSCLVEPVFCNKNECKELMLAHATASHPNHFFWYADQNNNYQCSKEKSPSVKHFSECNRVQREPLSAYLTDYQYGWFWYMQDPVFLGIHIEKII